jgi:hypothetical protein
LGLVQQQTATIDSTGECVVDAVYGETVSAAYTTRTATATRGLASLAMSGENFDCARFGAGDSPGELVSPDSANVAIIGDVAIVLRLAD